MELGRERSLLAIHLAFFSCLGLASCKLQIKKRREYCNCHPCMALLPLFRSQLAVISILLTLVVPIAALSSNARKCHTFLTTDSAHLSNETIPWPSWRLPANPEIAKVLPERIEHLEFQVAVKGSSALSKLTAEEIYRIAYDESVSLAFVKQNHNELEVNQSSPESVERYRVQVQRMARLIYTKLKVNLIPVEPAFTKENFKQQVKLSGEKLTRASLAYRLDQRPREEILAAGGFKPNPAKRTTGISILEHSFPTTKGGFFVSTTLKENNAKEIMPSGMFSSVAMPDQKAQQLLMQAGIRKENISLILSVRTAFEYKLQDITGVFVQGHGIKSEQEFVTNEIGLDQIVAVREVTLIEYLTPELARGLNIRPGDLAQAKEIRNNSLAFLPRETISGPWMSFR